MINNHNPSNNTAAIILSSENMLGIEGLTRNNKIKGLTTRVKIL